MKIDIIRAWTDVEYRATLTADQLAALPANPAGVANLSDVTLGRVVGGVAPTTVPQEAAGIFRTWFGSRKIDCCNQPGGGSGL